MGEYLYTIDCACLIHGDYYDWSYVENLHKMISRNTEYQVRMHVFTEESRYVPEPYVKHCLVEWPEVKGPRRAWWYKMQMFNKRNFRGRLLYFDLDVVIVNNIDWVLQCNPKYFWAIRDFKHLWRGQWNGINSSVMYWDVEEFNRLYKQFTNMDLKDVMRTYPGDQDFISKNVDRDRVRFLDEHRIVSWRWQAKDGGLNFKTKRPNRPNAGTVLPPNTSVLIFHGTPKPHEVFDPVINQHWRQ